MTFFNMLNKIIIHIFIILLKVKVVILPFLTEFFFLVKNLHIKFFLNLLFFFKQLFLILKNFFLFFFDIITDRTIFFKVLEKNIDICYKFYNQEKEDLLACIEYERELISTKWSNMKTLKDAWHIFVRHFLVPLFLLLGTAYIVGVIQHALIGLTYEHFGYVYNGKFPFTKF